GGTGGTSGTGGTGTAGYPNLVVAFIGDQGRNEDAIAVVDLIRDEGAQAVVHNGDLDYADTPSIFLDLINTRLGSSFPYFAVLGNHEEAAHGTYATALADRANGIPEMRDNCSGTQGYETSCNFRGVRIVQSCVGLGGIVQAMCGKDATRPIDHIRSSLQNDDSIWSVCNWHKVQSQMTVGDNPDEAGWQAYRACMEEGAIIITAHNHTYSRSYTLTDIDNTNVAANKGKIGTAQAMQVGPGRTFVLVTGIGGRGLYAAKGGAGPEAWWASYFTDELWLESGATQPIQRTGRQGALFIKFNVGGDPRRAEGWVKNIATPRELMDTFTIQAL
ncbi:MAG TPA: metallophosphoesterase, partial [Polyangiaceae bacterium]